MDKSLNKYDVFISYSSKDQIVAEGVCAYLESNKIRCFYAYRDIPKGPSWPSFIPPAIRNSRLMLAIFSKNFNASEETDNEITIAARRKIPVLVFRITDDSFDGTKEYFLTKSNWIEAFPEPEKCFGELYRNICILLDIKNNDNPIVNSSTIPIQQETIKGEAYVQKGLKILSDPDGDREMATYYFRKAAKESHPEGEYRLGLAYYQGNGISQSWENAMLWFKKAVEHGHSKAMEKLACIYHYGIGTERNTMRALELYTQSAMTGNGSAMKCLGKIFKTGELGVRDEQRSLEYYEQAFDVLYEQAMGENNAEAQHILGNSYLDGEGVKQSYSQAIKMYKRAIDSNYAASYNSLGLCYNSGLGVSKDLMKAFELQLKAAELGEPTAMSNIAKSYLYGEGIEKDEKKYLEWIRRAADSGNVGAQSDIGVNYHIGEILEKDLYQAQRWFEKAVAGGDYDGMNFLAMMYLDGDINDSDSKRKAFQLYKQAAIGGNVVAYIKLADCYYHGIGTDENDIEALRWYQKTADVYDEMKNKGEIFFTTESGANMHTFCNFENYKTMFAEVFDNLACIYRNSKIVEHNSSMAIKWENISKMLKGENADVEQLENIKNLEDEARKNNVEALDELLTIFEECSDELKLTEWATYALENKIFVKEADRLRGKDHVDLVLKKAKVTNHQIYVDYIESYLDNGGNMNCYALYNAACEEFKKRNLKMTKEYWKLILDDAKSLLGLNNDIFGAGYLRARQEHFDILFLDYDSSKIANGDFSSERDFKLFYVSHTNFTSDHFVSDYGLNIFNPMRNDISYNKVIELNNGEIVHAGNFDKAIINYINSYDVLCNENPSIKKEQIDVFHFSMLVPFCSAEQIQKYCMQIMKALISVRSLFYEKWEDVVSSMNDLDKLLDIAEKTTDENLQLMLIEYVEIQIEAEAIFRYAQKINLLKLDEDKVGIASELNNYVKRLEDNGIAHNLPHFTTDNLPSDAFDEEDDEIEEDYVEAEHVNDSKNYDAESLCQMGDDYYFGQNGKTKDYAEAINFFMKAAQLGNTYAQYSLAFCLENGQGTDVNNREAAKWYGKAAEQGHVSSQCSYGVCCELGKGVVKDLTEAIKWYKKSAEQNYAQAQELLGNCYYKGYGINKDLEQAKFWYEKAAKQGRESAQQSLEKILAEERKPHHIIKNDNKYGYTDQNYNIIIPCQWTKVEEFVEGVGLVWDGDKLGAINEKGQFYFPCKISCKEAKYLGHNLIKVKHGLWFIYNLDGVNTEYECFTEISDDFVNGYLYAVKYRLLGKNKSGKINIKGKFIED